MNLQSKGKEAASICVAEPRSHSQSFFSATDEINTDLSKGMNPAFSL